MEYSPFHSEVHLLGPLQLLSQKKANLQSMTMEKKDITAFHLNFMKLDLFMLNRVATCTILPQNALKRDRNSKCIDLIEGHYLKVVVLL